MDKKKFENLKGEIWKQYQDTPYWFSSHGRVKRIYKNNNERLLNPFTCQSKTGGKYLTIKIHGKATRVTKIIYRLFIGEIPEGYVVHHKDNHYKNNDFRNLELLTRKELGYITGGRSSMRRLIYDMDNKCFYKGTREAARKLFISRQTVSDYCNGKIKNPMVKIRWAKLDE